MRIFQQSTPKPAIIALAIVLTGFMLSCGKNSTMNNGDAPQPPTDNLNPVPLTQAEIEAGQYTPEIMWKMGRLGTPVLSPDGQQVLYSVRYYNVDSNSSFNRIFLQSTQGGDPQLLVANGNNPQWHPTDGSVCFLAEDADTQSQQLYSIATSADAKPVQLTHFKESINSYWLAPDGKHLLFARTVQVEPTTKDRYPDLPKANVRIIDSLMYRHWDYWVDGKYSHLFLTEAQDNGGFSDEATDLMPKEAWDAPMAPYFDESEVAWSPDAQHVYYTAKKLTGRAYATSTNSSIYRYTLSNGVTEALVTDNPGYDRNPVPSPCGKYLLWQRMATPGYESDRAVLMCMDMESRQTEALTEQIDQNADSYHWSADGKSIYIISGIKGTIQLFQLDRDTKAFTQLTQGQWDIQWARLLPDGQWLVRQTRLDRAAELYTFRDGTCTPFTHINDAIYGVIPATPVKGEWIATTNGEKMLTWFVYPPHFDSTKKYPTILYCQGGPQSTLSQFYSFRWCIQLLASQGYVVVMPNRHGVPSFGQAWNAQISGDYSGQNIKDYLTAIDHAAKQPWCDAERLGAVGASYGGYSVFYLAGVHNNRFKALIAHNGMFNFESFYGGTEETFFPNHDFGGAYWQHDNATAMRSYANSPHKNVHKWNTPILIIVGEKDFRIPYTEGLQAFNTAQLNGCPARLLVFPDETHFVSQPQNSVLWHHEFYNWLNRYLKQ